MSRLIVHADDFGISAGVNAGIVQAHRHGILTSASLMVSGAAFDGAVSLLRENPGLDAGVHLTLVGERPLLDPGRIPSLVDAGGRLPGAAPSFMRRYLAGRIDIEDVRRELDAQIGRARECVPAVSHLDSHQHLHMLPAVWKITMQLARRHGIRAVRRPREALRASMLLRPAGYPRLAQQLVLNAFCAAAGRGSLREPDHFFGFYHGGRLGRDNLLVLLRSLPADGYCELMCHPGSDATDAAHDWGYRWRDERDALTDEAVRRTVSERGIQLVSYADLAR